jgi:hypothetical protein
MRAMASFAPRPVSSANAGPRPSRQPVPAASALGSGASSSSTGGRGAVVSAGPVCCGGSMRMSLHWRWRRILVPNGCPLTTTTGASPPATARRGRGHPLPSGLHAGSWRRSGAGPAPPPLGGGRGAHGRRRLLGAVLRCSSQCSALCPVLCLGQAARLQPCVRIPLTNKRHPAQESGLGRYIKKKKLDPLDTYVPLVLQAQEQLLSLKGTVGEAPRWSRSGEACHLALHRAPA